MTIKYDGATFETVEELVAYKKAMGEIKDKPKKWVATARYDNEGITEIETKEEPQVTPTVSMSWSHEKVNKLIELVNTSKNQDGLLPSNFVRKITPLMGKTEGAVQHKLVRLREKGIIQFEYLRRDITKAKVNHSQSTYFAWTPEEQTIIENFLDRMGEKRLSRNRIINLAKKMNRPVNTIANKLSITRTARKNNPPKTTLKKHKHSAWTTEEYQRLKQIVDQYEGRLPTGVTDKLSRELKRTKQTIGTKLYSIRHGIIKVPTTTNPQTPKMIGGFTTQDIQTIIDTVKEHQLPSGITPTIIIQQLADQLGRDKHSITCKIYKLRKDGKIPKPHLPPMHNTHATVPDDYTTARIKLAHKGASQLKDEDLDFPKIFPISEMTYSQINHAEAWGFSRKPPYLNCSPSEKSLMCGSLFEKTLTDKITSQQFGDVIWLRTSIHTLIQLSTSLMLRLQLLGKVFTANTISTIISSGFQNTERNYYKVRWQQC